MPRYAAFLRGVMPMNAKMPDLKSAFEAAGFTDVKTVISSGNVVFTANRSSESTLQRKAEGAMLKRLGRHFLTIVRPVDTLRELLASDPYAAFNLVPGSKRIVTFLLEEPGSRVVLPLVLGDARILSRTGREVFSTYMPDPKGPDFMTLIEKTFGKNVTTRTWETVMKVAR